MKSIRTKILLLILSCIVFTVLIIGSAGILTVKKLVNNESKEVMNLICKERALQLNMTFTCIEQSVGTLGAYAVEQLDDIERFKTNSDYVNEYTKVLESVALNAANNTIGAIAVYIRFNPEFTSSTSGIFLTRQNGNEKFNEVSPTDLSLYDKNDVEHVGWFYVPVESKEAVWMPPYYNKNISVPMISYVIPLYADDVLIGVVGMDIDYNVIIDTIDSMQVYENGYAFLIDDNDTIMYHSAYERGTALTLIDKSISNLDIDYFNNKEEDYLYNYEINKTKKAMVLCSLKNGMTLALTAPKSEIESENNKLIHQIGIAAIIICVVCFLITIFITKKIIKPLIELKEAAQKIADGDLSIDLNYNSNDEIGQLTESFKKTATSLREYISYINNLAYVDTLTGIKNKTAYINYVNKIDTKIKNKTADFAVAVFDVNNLKYTNDTYGHEDGDKLIKIASMMICTSFKHSPVFRIGGDEFVAILEKSDFENKDKLISEFYEKMQCGTGKESESISIACGCAVYNPNKDSDYSSVFRHADNIMYTKKQEMKSLLDSK